MKAQKLTVKGMWIDHDLPTGRKSFLRVQYGDRYFFVFINYTNYALGNWGVAVIETDAIYNMYVPQRNWHTLQVNTNQVYNLEQLKTEAVRAAQIFIVNKYGDNAARI